MSEKMNVHYSLEYVNRKRFEMGKCPMPQKQYDSIYARCERQEKHSIDVLTELVLAMAEKEKDGNK